MRDFKLLGLLHCLWHCLWHLVSRLLHIVLRHHHRLLRHLPISHLLITITVHRLLDKLWLLIHEILLCIWHHLRLSILNLVECWIWGLCCHHGLILVESWGWSLCCHHGLILVESWGWCLLYRCGLIWCIICDRGCTSLHLHWCKVNYVWIRCSRWGIRWFNADCIKNIGYLRWLQGLCWRKACEDIIWLRFYRGLICFWWGNSVCRFYCWCGKYIHRRYHRFLLWGCGCFRLG